MLVGLRDFAKSWPGKIMGAFLLVGVAGFGINNVILDLGSNTVARVGSQEITSREFLRAYQSQINRVASQFGSIPTVSEAESLGIPTGVLLSLSEGAALDGLAEQYDLGVSEAKLGEMLRTDPSFRSALGTFDAGAFQQVLQASGWTESEYFGARANEAKREQLVLSLFGDAALPAVGADLINKYAATRRTIDYITLSDANIETPAEPSEAELAAYLTEHQNEYRTVETRKVQLIDLSIASLAATMTVDEADIVAEYERSKANLTTQERRTIQQAVLTTPEQQAAFEAGLAAGTDFATLATENGVTPTVIGTRTKGEITDRTLADAAFGVDEGKFVIISGIAGKRAVYVETVEPAAQTSLEDARESIAASVAASQARTEINEVLDQIEELRAAFQSLDEIAKRFGLELYDVDVTADGEALNALPNLSNEDRVRVSQAIFRAEKDKLVPSVPLAGNAHIWFDLIEVSPARDQTLDEVRTELETTLTNERTNAALKEFAEGMVARLDGGESLAELSMPLGLFPQLSTPFSRFGSDDGSVDANVASAAFTGGPENNGSVLNSSGEWIVFEVVDNSPPAEELDAETTASLNTEALNTLYADFVGAVRDDAGLRINQQALTQLLTLNYSQ